MSYSNHIVVKTLVFMAFIQFSATSIEFFSFKLINNDANIQVFIGFF